MAVAGGSGGSGSRSRRSAVGGSGTAATEATTSGHTIVEISSERPPPAGRALAAEEVVVRFRHCLVIAWRQRQWRSVAAAAAAAARGLYTTTIKKIAEGKDAAKSPQWWPTTRSATKSLALVMLPQSDAYAYLAMELHDDS